MTTNLAMTTLALGPKFLDPNWLLTNVGIIGILIIVFAESGLLIGFFLPGDSLLFTTGLFVSQKLIGLPLWLVCLLTFLAAFLGDQAGYLFGRKVGPSLFNRPNSRLFKRENVEKAHGFFERHGSKSIVLARFVPVIRTFTPIVAGVSRMNYRTFTLFNGIGGLLWGSGVTLLGYWLGQIAVIRDNIEAMLVVIVLVSVVPVAIELLRARRKSKAAAADPAPARTAPPAPQPAPAPGAPQYPQPHPYSNHPQPNQHPQAPAAPGFGPPPEVPEAPAPDNGGGRGGRHRRR